MTVRELIEHLLDYEMETEVRVMIENDSVNEDVALDDIDTTVLVSEVVLIADLSGYSLIESDEFNRLQELEG